MMSRTSSSLLMNFFVSLLRNSFIHKQILKVSSYGDFGKKRVCTPPQLNRICRQAKDLDGMVSVVGRSGVIML